MNITQKEKSKQALRIFLSYSLVDKEYAQKLRNSLYGHEDLSIFSLEMLSAGEDWQSRLKNEISQCDIFIILLSPKSIESSWVLRELGAAWALDKIIVPILTQPELLSRIPIQIEGVQSIDINYLEEHPELLSCIIDQYKENMPKDHD